MAKPISVVDILVPGEPTEHRLPELRHQAVPTVLAGSAVGQHFARTLAQAERVIQFPKRQQSRVRSDHRAMEFQLQAPVEIDPQIARLRFTRWVRHDHTRKPSTSH